MKINRGLRFPKVMFKIVCRLDYMPTLPPRCCIAFSMLGYAILRNSGRPSRQDVVLPFLVRSKLFLAKATTSRRDVSCKHFPSPGASFPREGRNCKPSLAAYVSPISPGASVKGELLPTLAARTCFNFAFVSPYLLCKPNLDDTCQLSTAAILRLQLVFRPYPLARR